MSERILIYSKREEFQSVLESEIKELSGIKPVIQESLEDLYQMVELLGKVDILIIDMTYDEVVLNQVRAFIFRKLDALNKIIFVTDKKFLLCKTKVFSDDEFLEAMEYLGKCFTSSSEIDEYIAMPIDSFVHCKVLPFDIYIKISKEKFIKRIPAYEEIDRRMIHSMKLKGIYELFYDKKHNKEFSRIFLTNMMNDLEKDHSSVQEEQTRKTEIFQTTKEIVQHLGLSPRIIALCESVMNAIVRDVSHENGDIAYYLQSLLHSRLSFHYRYIELSSYLASQLVDNFQTFSSSDFTKRVVFAAFFSDVTLKKTEWIHIRNDEQLKTLSEVCLKEISHHALRASELISSYRGAPFGVDRIIKHHHGSLNGIGFSDRYDKLCPITKSLICSQELAYSILTELDKDPKTVLNEVSSKYLGTPLYEFFTQLERAFNIQGEELKVSGASR